MIFPTSEQILFKAMDNKLIMVDATVIHNSGINIEKAIPTDFQPNISEARLDEVYLAGVM